MNLETALFTGLAPDGGLYVPEALPRLAPEPASDPPRLTASAARVLSPFADDLTPSELAAVIDGALDFPIPLVPLAAGCHVLELFHGPTLAFKDVGARFMARLMACYVARRPRQSADDSRALTVLVATSGDTGSAVAQAFAGAEGIRVAVLYPRGRVSRLQEMQLTTVGGNVLALAVAGDFDDCQRLVKEAFADRELASEFGLTSANSINIGRLLPQMTYYFHAVDQLGEGAAPPLFSTPSGNFGNLTAGLMARFLGLPATGFVAATNVNDSVPRFLAGADFAPHPARPTLSSAMDVGRPSNFDRMLRLFDGDRGRMQEVIVGSRHDDNETAEIIRRVHAETGYVLDPHTAVGYLGLVAHRRELEDPPPGIVLATAHPAKFRGAIRDILGFEVELPERLARCLELPSEARRIEPELAELVRSLRD